MENLDSEILATTVLRKLKSQRKAERVQLAQQLNGNNNILERFEQFSTSVQLSELTMNQLWRYLERKIPTLPKTTLVELCNKYEAFKNWNWEECSVCMEPMGRQKNSLSCGHWIHFECMRKAVTTKCPLCRKEVGDCIPRTFGGDMARQLQQLRALFPGH